MEFYIQQVLNALQVGSVYALIALGYTMVYGILIMINFAHGDIFMVSTYLAFFFSTMILGLVTGLNPIFVFVLTLLVAMFGTALLARAARRDCGSSGSLKAESRRNSASPQTVCRASRAPRVTDTDWRVLDCTAVPNADPAVMAGSSIVFLLVLVAGLVYFNRMERQFADVI